MARQALKRIKATKAGLAVVDLAMLTAATRPAHGDHPRGHNRAEHFLGPTRSIPSNAAEA